MTIKYLRNGVFLYTGPQQHFDSLVRSGLWEPIPIYTLPYETRLEINERLDAKGIKRQTTGVNDAGKNCWEPNDPCGKVCRPRGTCKQGKEKKGAGKGKRLTVDDVRAKLIERVRESKGKTKKKGDAKTSQGEVAKPRATRPKSQKLGDILKDNGISREDYNAARDKAAAEEVAKLTRQMKKPGADAGGIQAQIDRISKMSATTRSKTFGAKAIKGILAARSTPAPSNPPKQPKQSKPPKSPKQPKATPSPDPATEPSTRETPPGGSAPKSVAPSLKAQDFNPHAKPNLSVKEFKSFWDDKIRLNSIQSTPVQSYDDWASGADRPTKNGYRFYLDRLVTLGIPVEESAFESAGIKLGKKERGRLQANRDKIATIQGRVDEMQKAIDHPLVSDEEAKGFKPRMTPEEANAYTAGSFTGNLKFYHGNGPGVIDSMEKDGIQPSKNYRGIYGKGAYFGASEEIGRDYQSAAALNQGSSGLVEVQIKVKNPAIISVAEYAKIQKFFDAGKSDEPGMSDSDAVQEYFRAMGHDSIYLEDLGYFVTFDTRQTVITNIERAKAGSPEAEKLREFQAELARKRKERAANGQDAYRGDFDQSRTGKALASVKPRTLIQGGNPDDDEEFPL